MRLKRYIDVILYRNIVDLAHVEEFPSRNHNFKNEKEDLMLLALYYDSLSLRVFFFLFVSELITYPLILKYPPWQ